MTDGNVGNQTIRILCNYSPDNWWLTRGIWIWLLFSEHRYFYIYPAWPDHSFFYFMAKREKE